MSGKRDSARAALGRVQHLHPAQHEDILRELDREALLDDSRGGNGFVRAVAAPALPERTCLTPIEVMSANADSGIRVRRCLAEAKRLGYEIKPNVKIDTFALDEALKGKDVEARMSLKRNLAAMGMIP